MNYKGRLRLGEVYLVVGDRVLGKADAIELAVEEATSQEIEVLRRAWKIQLFVVDPSQANWMPE